MHDARLLIVTGKGGVGKTTLCAALCLAAQSKGKRVLLVQVGTAERSTNLFGSFPLGYEIRPVSQGIDAMLLDPFAALQEYIASQIKIKPAVKFLVENNIFRYLVGVAPGWRELITLGKIWVMEGKTTGGRNKRPLYDLIVVDAPATGHGISFLRVPQVVLNVLKFGPVKTYTKKVQDLLRDERRTRLLIVSLPEEMPVNEALEIYRASREHLHIPLGPILLNAIYPPLVQPELDKPLERLLNGEEPKLERAAQGLLNAELLRSTAQAYQERREIQLEAAARLRSQTDLPVIDIPFMFTNRFDMDNLRRIQRSLQRLFEPGDAGDGR
ncbi:MAG: ArsA family ATPase [Candidatus Alcyoniella australis]|nr:ArsA family ATPase [Candidatus Alcyoniella australis]